MKGPLLPCIASSAGAAAMQLDAWRPSALRAGRMRRGQRAGVSWAQTGTEARCNGVLVLQRLRLAPQGSGDAMQLTPESSEAVFNGRQLANMPLTKAGEDDRMIRQRGRAVGLCFPTTQCMTGADGAGYKTVTKTN